MDGPLGHAGSDNLDRTVLPGLFARLGPDVARQLRRQLVDDLAALRANLASALAAPGDGAALSREAHVLTALAGTAGDAGLCERAREVSDLLRAGNLADATRQAAMLDPLVGALIALVAACPLSGLPTWR